VTGWVPPLEIQESDLNFVQKVGSGGFGSVWRGQWISRRRIVAIKTMIDIDEGEVRDSCITCQIQQNNTRLVMCPFLDLT